MNFHIKLKTTDIYDIEARLRELNEIREWINELVLWKLEMFSISYHGSGQKIIVWFENDEHAAFCALRWV
jgi:hypothetical protein